MSNNIPNAATLLEFANLQVAAEALYDKQNITETEPITPEHLTFGNDRTSKRRSALRADIHKISIPQFAPDISGSLKAAN